MRHHVHRFIFAVIGLLCWCLASCQFDPWAGDFLTKQPLEKDLVGRYRVDSDSLHRRVVDKQFAGPGGMLPISSEAEIVLAEDHTVRLVKVTDFTYLAEQHSWRVCSYPGSGSWELGRNDDFWVVRVDVRKRLSGDCESNTELFLYGKHPPYKLHITVGDPDSGDAIQFEKPPSP